MTSKSGYRAWCRNLHVRRVALLAVWTFLVPVSVVIYGFIGAIHGAVYVIKKFKEDWEPEQ